MRLTYNFGMHLQFNDEVYELGCFLYTLNSYYKIMLKA